MWVLPTFFDASYEAVKKYLSSFRNVQIHPGAFKEICAKVTDAAFSLVHIDVDIYRSTVNCLEFFWPRLSDGGVIVVDDCGFVACQGAKQAVRYVHQLRSSLPDLIHADGAIRHAKYLR